MDALNPVLAPVQRVWRGLSRGQQIGFVAVLAALGGLLFIVTTVGKGPDSAVAFSGLSNDDEAAIVQKLKDAKIPYELQDGGTIRVPSGQVQDARLATAGKRLDTAQARSISNLVAGSVQGLKTQNLTIVDVNGNTLTPDDGVSSTTGLSTKQLDSQRGYESATEHNLQAMLDNVLGPGKATVRVAAVMNWDQIEQTNETYTPGDPTKTPVLTNHTITDSSNGGAAAAAGAGGIPGAASNNAAVQTYQGANGSTGTTSETDTETTYQLNKSVQKTVRAPGVVTRMSVSVMLDDAPNNPNAAL